jgi:hypothetical protein
MLGLQFSLFRKQRSTFIFRVQYSDKNLGLRDPRIQRSYQSTRRNIPEEFNLQKTPPSEKISQAFSIQ